MYVYDLFERRRNPEQNPKETPVEFLRKYKDNPKMYLHMAPILKVGIFPRSSHSHDSPAGVYAYRLADIWKNYIERWNTGEYKRGLEFLPYFGGDHLFILESDIDADFPGHYSEQDLARDTEKLRKLYHFDDRELKQLKRTARTNQNFRDLPAGMMWGMTKALIAGVDEFDQYTPVNTRRWNHLLRRLGYFGFNDPGHGVIHGAESCQAVFLTTSAFRVVDHMLRNRRQRMVTIGDKKYIGGRLPKNLVMNGIPNTLFYNHTPDDFMGIRTWTVMGMGVDDLTTFFRFVPWNAQGIVNTLAIGNAANEFYESSRVQDFFNKVTIPPNITIKNLYVGKSTPYNLIRYVPENFPVQTITISKFASDYGLDKLPEKLRAKIIQAG